MATAAVHGTELFYEEVGTGPTCLMMHGGLGYDHHYFRPAFDRLASRLRLVYYDHRGNGRSGRPPLDTLTMEQLADDAAGLATHLGAEQVVVIGHSYGGFVAQEFAVRHPGRVTALVLCGTTPGQRSPSERPDEEQGPPPPPELLAVMRSMPSTDEEFAATVRKILPFYVHRADPAELEAAIEGTIFTAATMVRSMEVLSRWSVADRLGAVQAPVLLLVGHHDLFCSPPQSHRIARRLPTAEVVELDDSGHMLWMDEPDRFFGVLESWLDRVVAGTGEASEAPPA